MAHLLTHQCAPLHQVLVLQPNDLVWTLEYFGLKLVCQIPCLCWLQPMHFSFAPMLMQYNLAKIELTIVVR